MVHALREGHRVLRPGGMLIDLRPASVHRRIGLGEGRAWRLVGVMREPLEEDHRADRAVERVIREGLFRVSARGAVLLERVMDDLDDFRAWLTEFNQRRVISAHSWLIHRLERARRMRSVRIVSRGPLTIRVLEKLGPPAQQGGRLRSSSRRR